MPYPALPDKRIGFDNDGTVVYYTTGGIANFVSGPTTRLTGSSLIALNNYLDANLWTANQAFVIDLWFFFPEKRECDGVEISANIYTTAGVTKIQGSNDTTNGMDGTWEVGSFTSGVPGQWLGQPDWWRSNIMPVSFTGTKQTVRLEFMYQGNSVHTANVHLYGIKDASATPDDLIFMTATSGGTQILNEDVGDVGLGTTRTMQAYLYNTSATKTASTINLQLNDADWIFSTDNATWVTSINVASLGPGAYYGPIYIRNTAPAQGSRLGPRTARIVVSGYTFA